MKISIYRKIVLIFAGLMFSLLLLESGMRLAGCLILGRQKSANIAQMKENKSCRVLCIGESTTMGQYPNFLLEALNQGKYKGKFSVIDEGLGATDTSRILESVPRMFKTYKPQIMVAMMGINDDECPSAVCQKKRFYSSLRLYKLYEILRMHILGREFTPVPDLRVPDRNTWENTIADRYKRPIDEPLDDLFNKAYRKNEADEAESELKKMALKHPNEGRIYMELSLLYFRYNKYTEAKAMLQKGLEKGITNPYAVYCAISTLLCTRCPEQVENIINNMLDRTPALRKKSWPFMHIGRAYKRQRKYVSAEKMLRKALSINPYNIDAYIDLSETLLKQKKLKENEALLLEGISKSPKTLKLKGMLGAFYLEMGQNGLAEKYFDEAEAERAIFVKLITYLNYLRIIELAVNQNIIVFCMEYPMRSATPLKNMVESESLNNTIFVVDNEKIFKDAVSKEEYDALFTDKFGGDFGHCTEKGNRLIAENLARHILEKLGPDISKETDKQALHKS